MIRLNLQNDPHAYNVLAELGGVTYRLLLRWAWRTSDWRISAVDTRDGTYVATNRRISPGSAVFAFDDGAILWASGGDPYGKEALGVTLRVDYYTVQDLANVTAVEASGFDPVFVLK